jgi:hypothetical protein
MFVIAHFSSSSYPQIGPHQHRFPAFAILHTDAVPANDATCLGAQPQGGPGRLPAALRIQHERSRAAKPTGCRLNDKAGKL